VPTKFHTIAASSWTPCSWLEGPTPASLEKDPVAWFGTGELRGFVLRIDETWPLVFKIAPDARSRTMVALTPGFLERRLSVSSRASAAPVLCEALLD